LLFFFPDGNEERKAALCCELQCFHNSVINENEKQFFILSCLYYDNIALLCFCEPDLKVSIKSQEKEFSILEIAVKMNAINVVEELLKGTFNLLFRFTGYLPKGARRLRIPMEISHGVM